MKFSIYLLASFSFLLQLTVAARNYASVEEGIADSARISGKIRKGDIFIFKEWWAPKPNNPEDIRRKYSHVRVVILKIAGTNNNLAQGRAFDIVIYKLDENGQPDPAPPTAADQVIDENGYPATPLWMSSNDEIWYANRYKKNGHLVSVSKANEYRLVARNPPGFNNVEEIYDALRARGKSYFYTPL